MESYVISLKEVLWGVLLLGLTMAIHGMGMLLTLRVTNWLKDHTKPPRPLSIGLGIVILATWIIIITSLVEVVVWGQFFIFLGAQPTSSVAIYHALVNYTTLDSGYLPQEWRLLEGLLAMAGLMTSLGLRASCTHSWKIFSGLTFRQEGSSRTRLKTSKNVGHVHGC